MLTGIKKDTQSCIFFYIYIKMKEILKLFVLTLPIYLVIFFLLWGGDKFSSKDLMRELNQRDSIISQMINDRGEKVITHTNREYHPFVIKNSNDAEMVELRSQLRELGIKIKDLKSAIEIQAEASGGGKTELVRVSDTLDTYSFADSTSKHLKLNGTVDVFNGLMDYEYTYSANYDIIAYDYKAKLFKKPELRLKIISDDPSNNIKAKTFTVKPPRDIISIGAGIGGAVFYDSGNIKVRPAIQIGIYKPIYTFRSKN